MKLSALGEFGLIEKIRKSTTRSLPSILVGIGDDAAALKTTASAYLLATTDMLIEGVHFDLAYTDFYSLGWKSMAVNLSDIAAMGGSPRFCLTSLGIPPVVSVEQISEFYRGFNSLLKAHRVALVGGDTCSSPRGMVVSVTVLGETDKKNIISRAGAKPGDRIFVTGTLGDSAAGLELLRNAASLTPLPSEEGTKKRGSTRSTTRNQQSAINKLIEKHLRPVPRIEWGRKLALSRCATAMIDVSDGLSSDLSHICEQSGVGAVIADEKVPRSALLQRVSPRLKNPLLHYALSGGEDYELLFTIPKEKTGKLRSLGVPATEIGEITRTRKMLIMDSRGKAATLRPTGFNHFVRASS